MSTKPLALGQTLKDRITGFKGVAVTRVEYLTGCVQYGLAPQCGEDLTKVPDTQFFDFQRLEFVDAGPLAPSEQTNGGTNRDAPRA